jgi:hypothetical protein
MSEEERKEKSQEIQTSKHLYKYFGIASFVLGLFSFMVELYFWIDVFVDVYSHFLNVRYDVYFFIVTILGFLAILSTFPAFILGILAFFKMKYKENRSSKILALCGIILSLLYWASFSLQYIEWGGYYLD